MIISPLDDYTCPLDGLILAREYKTVKCAKGHEYDLSKKGYCNLLVVQDKSSLDPGDNKDMVAARHNFLNGGHFAPIAQRVFAVVHECAKANAKRGVYRVVDAGCGEGYYLHQMEELARELSEPLELKLAGCDISKWAIKFASHRSTQIGWAVASNRRLPFEHGTIDMILSIFGYPGWESFRNVQTKDGLVLIVEPGPDHLVELRKIIYPSLNKNSSSGKQPTTSQGYTLEKTENLKFCFELDDSAQIMDMLYMTPHAYRVMKDRRDQLQKVKKMTVTVDVNFRLLKRDPSRKN